MHQRTGKKILIYFFLLFLVGSINNTNLSKIQFEDIEDINVVGLDNNGNFILSNKIKNLKLSNIFLINSEKIIKQVNSNKLVEKFYIFKKYPSSLHVNIEKTQFFARINNNGKISLVGSNGKLIKNDFLNNDLPFIFGNPIIDEFLNFKKIIDQSKISYDQIKNLYFFPSKRWDLQLKNNIIIKLSNDNNKKSLDFVHEFLHNKELRDIKIIDARIKNQIILNDR
tara:strand:- start:706 stop:1380 length:675 start_codon:yes stop_codon:yes gene_type:complete